VTVVVNRFPVDPDGVADWQQPRGDVVDEVLDHVDEDGTRHFTLGTGPFHEWERSVAVEADSDRVGRGPTVVETVRYRLAVPVWGAAFSWALRGRLRRGATPPGSPPWWAPPEVLDARASTVLAILGVLALVAGYLGTVITQTITYAAAQFDATTVQQGTLLAGVRIGVLLSLVIVSIADRRGRRVVLLAAVIGGCVVTATGAVAPGMVWLGTTQTVARALSTVAAILIAVIAVEEMPSGARAFAVSVLAMAAALGAGICVGNLVYVDVSPGAWRGIYLVPLLALVPVVRVGRLLPETRRFELHHIGPRPAAPGDASAVTHPPVPATPGFDWSRFALLAVAGFCWSLFIAPASQFLNEYLRTERDFSGIQITLFVLLTNTPGGIGVVAGGRVAERRGRRLIGIIGVTGGVAFTVLTYLVWGWPLWAASVLGSVVGAMAIPALGVYGPELFPTSQRGRANGGLQVVAVAGSSVGLLAAGWLADAMGSLGPAIALLALGPLVLVVLVATLYPETAHRELEDINPGDRL
jgi:MFS family permease